MGHARAPHNPLTTPSSVAAPARPRPEQRTAHHSVVAVGALGLVKARAVRPPLVPLEPARPSRLLPLGPLSARRRRPPARQAEVQAREQHVACLRLGHTAHNRCRSSRFCTPTAATELSSRYRSAAASAPPTARSSSSVSNTSPNSPYWPKTRGRTPPADCRSSAACGFMGCGWRRWAGAEAGAAVAKRPTRGRLWGRSLAYTLLTRITLGSQWCPSAHSGH